MKILKVTAKCSDMFDATFNTSEGDLLGIIYSGYVPHWFPNPSTEHYGDYVELNIDLDTGKILNWKKPTQKQLAETFKF